MTARTPNTTCATCGKSIWKKPSSISRYKNVFCSNACKNAHHGHVSRRGSEMECSECGAAVYRSRAQLKRSASGRVFCSRSCSVTFRNKRRTGAEHPNWNGGAGYRARALNHYGARCHGAECPLDEVEIKMLDVHHVDGDRSNNEIGNLEVLCVWCHALETRRDW